MKQKITVLGSTGSIGKNTLDVVARHPDRYEVFALSAATQVDLMLQQCAQFKPRFAVMASAPHSQLLAEKIKQNGLQTSVLQAQGALEIIASHEEVDAVMAAIVGAAGLSPCLAAARAGKRLLLANKEALVVGGNVFMRAVREGGLDPKPLAGLTMVRQLHALGAYHMRPWGVRSPQKLFTAWICSPPTLTPPTFLGHTRQQKTPKHLKRIWRRTSNALQ